MMLGKFISSDTFVRECSKMKNSDELKNEKFIYLTTKGRKTGKMHVVELWFAHANNRIYLSHEGEFTDWMKNIEKNGKVKMKVGSENFEGSAVIAPAGSDAREIGKKALYEKYYGPVSQQALDDWFELSTVVEVSPDFS